MPATKTICDKCPKKDKCRELCEKVEGLLDSPDKARPRCDLDAMANQEIDALLDRALNYDSRTRAMVFLYYRSGFSLLQIGRAFDVSASTVFRRIKAVKENRPIGKRRKKRRKKQKRANKTQIRDEL